MTNSRRQFIAGSALGLGALAVPSIGLAQAPDKKLNIVCVGAHPDDPESGCGGTLAKYANAGHTVTVVYLTRGEGGIPGKSADEAAAIRTKEAEAACKWLNVRPVFAGQVDGDTMVNNAWIRTIGGLIEREKPDIVFAHWPMDTHRDHQAASLMTIQAWVQAKQKFDLYFFEVCSGEQTMAFRPTDYVDITDTQAQKRKAVFCHESQDPEGIYACGHEIAEKFRGVEMGVTAAEGFIRMTGRNSAGII